MAQNINPPLHDDIDNVFKRMFDIQLANIGKYIPRIGKPPFSHNIKKEETPNILQSDVPISKILQFDVPEIGEKPFAHYQERKSILDVPQLNIPAKDHYGTADETPEEEKSENELLKIFHEAYKRDRELADRAKQYADYKTILDTALTTGSLLQNMLGQRPDIVTPDLISKPVMPTRRVTQEQQIENLLSGNLAAARQLAMETGRSDIMSGVAANIMQAAQEAKGQIAEQELERQVAEEGLRTNVEAQNVQLQNRMKLYSDQKLQHAALGLSEANAQLLSNYSGILAEHIKTNVALENQNNVAEVAFKLIEMGVPIDAVERTVAQIRSMTGGVDEIEVVKSGGASPKTGVTE